MGMSVGVGMGMVDVSSSMASPISPQPNRRSGSRPVGPQLISTAHVPPSGLDELNEVSN